MSGYVKKNFPVAIAVASWMTFSPVPTILIPRVESIAVLGWERREKRMTVKTKKIKATEIVRVENENNKKREKQNYIPLSLLRMCFRNGNIKITPIYLSSLW
jgi:hypothetical protein